MKVSASSVPGALKVLNVFIIEETVSAGNYISNFGDPECAFSWIEPTVD